VVSILATGSELREPGATLAPGQIYESNRAALRSLVQLTGARVQVLPLVRDTLAETTAALASALTSSDVILTSGGVSVGEADHVKEAFTRAGGEIDLWQVAIKPGKPFVFGRCGDKFLFGLPGNPVSALVTFALLVRPALLRWQGAERVNLPVQRGQLTEPLANRGGRRHFIRVVLEPDGRVRPAGLQASHALRSLAAANGLVDVPPGGVLEAGSEVRVELLDH
jgi:molybdopterin molybdotransferase